MGNVDGFCDIFVEVGCSGCCSVGGQSEVVDPAHCCLDLINVTHITNRVCVNLSGLV